MLITLRPYGGLVPTTVDKSKTAQVRDLLEDASRAFDADVSNIDLLFGGKILSSDSPLLVLGLKDKDVVGVRIRCPKPASPVKAAKSALEADAAEQRDDCVPEYTFFRPGDNLYYHDVPTGQWREAIVRGVEKDTSENVSPNQGDSTFVYIVHDGELDEDRVLPLSSLRPCGSVEYKESDLKAGMEVLAYAEPKAKLGWYRVLITNISRTNVVGTIYLGGDSKLEKQPIKFCHRTIQFPALLPRAERMTPSYGVALAKPCLACKSHPTLPCRHCSCDKCGGKNDEDKQIICDECEDAFHMYCLDPPLHEMPDSDLEWFCPHCVHVDDEVEERAKSQNQRKKDKADRALKVFKEKGKDWGKGLCTAGVSEKFCVVAKEHVGRIPGVPSGRLFASRIDVCSLGVHRPTVAGICGTVNTGVQSVCFSGGYEGDYDHGLDFVMSGSGGRDLSDNRRINKQSLPQTLTGTNLALAQCCYAMINDTVGSTSVDWRRGLPVRVIRGYKLAKISEYAPKEGYRYDGLYKVVRYFKQEVNGNVMWKFHLRRDDSEPAPWTSSGFAFMRERSIGHMEGLKNLNNNEDAGVSSKPKTVVRKRKWSTIEEAMPPVPRKTIKFELNSRQKRLMDSDEANLRNWQTVVESTEKGYPTFIRSVAEQFTCIICQDVVKDPFTPGCGHNCCLTCFRKWEREKGTRTCPFCLSQVEGPLAVNRRLDWLLNDFLPGYNMKGPQPRPYCLIRK